MNRIKILIVKDIALNWVPLVLYLLLGLISLWLLTFEQKGVFYTGSVIMLSMVIIAGVHMVINTVTTERDDQVLPFIMSLPITFIQYTHAKVCANLSVFLTFWLVMLGGLMWVIFSQAQIPDGLAVYTVILMLEMLAVFVLLLAVGLISESQTWTIVVMTFTNIGLSIFIFWLSGFEAINSYMETDQVMWNGTALTFVASELLFILLCLSITYVIQTRKTDFL